MEPADIFMQFNFTFTQNKEPLDFIYLAASIYRSKIKMKCAWNNDIVKPQMLVILLSLLLCYDYDVLIT